MKIIFMGTPEFAVPSLDMLVNEGYNISGVVTQTDKPKGRGQSLSMPPVKEYALSRGIKVLQPVKLKSREFIEELMQLAPELLITAAYGRILPKEVLDIPSMGCINVHGSLLPKYRGAAPIHRAVINGEKVSGITTMLTDEGMDTGDILLKAEMEVSGDMTAGELHDKLSVLGARVLSETLAKLREGSLKRVPQVEEEATYAPVVTKETGLIDWTASPEKIHNLVRGTNPWPGAYTYLKKNMRMRIWKTKLLPADPTSLPHSDTINEANPGSIYKVNREGIYVYTGDGLLQIIEIQFDSSRKMSVDEYIHGHKINEGEILG